jgi:hypothetical protein
MKRLSDCIIRGSSRAIFQLGSEPGFNERVSIGEL